MKHIQNDIENQKGEYKNLSQFMFGGEIQNIRFKYFGPSVEAVLDKLPNAEIESAAEDHFVIHAEVFGTGILMWLLSQGSKVEVLSPQAIRDKWLAEAKAIIARAGQEH